MVFDGTCEIVGAVGYSRMTARCRFVTARKALKTHALCCPRPAASEPGPLVHQHRFAGAHAIVGDPLVQARALLDDPDECLLVLAHDEDRAVFAELETLRATLNELDTRRSRLP